MARLVVDDSTDEFPDIDVLVARAAGERGVATATAPAPALGVSGNGEGKSMKKKRVLGRRDDNPLLRPLGSVRGERKAKALTVGGGKAENELVKQTPLKGLGIDSLRLEGVEKRSSTLEIPETQVEEDSGRKPARTVRRPKMVEKRNATPISDAEDQVPATTARVKTRTVSRKTIEKTPQLEIQDTQREAEASHSEGPIPPTSSRLKTRIVRSKKRENTTEVEIQETQQVVSSISDSEAPAPVTTTRPKTRTVRPKRSEKTPELEVQETQQEDDLRTVRPKSRTVETREKTPILEIQETQQEENMRTVVPKSRRLVKRYVTPSSDSEDPAAVMTSRINGTAKGRKRLDTPELDEDELCASNKPSRPVVKRAPSKEKASRATPELEDEDAFFSPLDEESDGMSDFVVNDSEIEDVPASRSVRRLVKGRRPDGEEKKHGMRDLEGFLRELKIDDESDPFAEPARAKRSKETSTGRKGAYKENVDTESIYSKARPSSQTSTDLDDHFTIKFTPPGKKAKKISRELRFTTPPGSPEPKPKGLQSPKKLQQIPATPHGPSVDDFWSQDVVNDWNDENSPRKTPRPPPKSLFSKGNSISEGDLFSPKKSPVKQDRIIKDAKKAFAERKHLLAETFLIELDTIITNGQVAKLAASTGGIKIIWSKKLNTTAGRANWKRETIRSSTLVGPDGKPLITYRHHAAIELAEKVIDDEDRLLNVIAHEFCHLANFMISNIKTNPHGKEFKAWASQVSRHFKDRGIEVTTKHSYTIDYKYIWECENCGLEFKRHSKSIDPTRHRCGSCKAKLVQMKPVPRKGMVVSEYQVFLKENMKVVMKENPKSPQKEILGLVGKRYQEFKAGRAAGEKSESVEIREVDVTSKEGTPEEDGLDLVSRKLDFLDLTSP